MVYKMCGYNRHNLKSSGNIQENIYIVSRHLMFIEMHLVEMHLVENKLKKKLNNCIKILPYIEAS